MRDRDADRRQGLRGAQQALVAAVGVFVDRRCRLRR
jgi:hypothetical protein